MFNDLKHLSDEQILAVRAWRMIRDDPSSWDQWNWRNPSGWDEKNDNQNPTRCGAKLCWGGHVVSLAGGKFITNNPESKWFSNLLFEPGDPAEYNSVIQADDFEIRTTSVPGRLRSLLGLNATQVSYLVQGDNSLQTLKELIIKFLRVDPQTGLTVASVEVDKSAACYCGDPACTRKL